MVLRQRKAQKMFFGALCCGHRPFTSPRGTGSPAQESSFARSSSFPEPLTCEFLNSE